MEKWIASMKLNRPQALFLTIMANIIYLFWSRGTGKTFGAGSPWILHKVEVMPGSAGAIIGQSFSDLKAKILKPLFAGFQHLGHKEGVHYVFGKRPPNSWKKPILPIIDYTHVISFPNGTTIQLVSLHQVGSANSNSFQWAYFPEAKFLKEKQMQEVIPAIRGLVEEFGDSPWYAAMLFETDKLSPNIHWLLKQRALHNERKAQAVLWLQLKYNELRIKMSEVSESHAYKIKEQMARLETAMNKLRKGLVYVSEAKAMDNIENLSASYFENQKKILTPYEYSIAIDNQDPTKAEDGFYPDRTDHHVYAIDKDDDPTQPIAVALDYQASIVPLVSAQINDHVESYDTLNLTRNFYVKHPHKVKDVVEKFCDFHKNRECKTVIYFYDHTAIGESANAGSYKDDVLKAFKGKGWKVNPVYMGQAPSHEDKYRFVSKVLKEEDPTLMPVRFHQERTSTLLLAMDMAETKDGVGTEKDKSQEKKKNIPQEYTTHFTDVFDQIIWAVQGKGLYPKHSKSTNSGAFSW